MAAKNSLLEYYKHLFPDMKRLAHDESKITEDITYVESNPGLLKIIDGMVEENVLPGSRIEGVEHFTDFLNQVKAGKHGLILMEHYSNFDLPMISYLLRRDDGVAGKQIAERLVAIAGMKLSEESPLVSAWAQAYSRVIIYPSRSLAAITDPVKHAEEEARSRKINMSSMRSLDRARRNGKIVLVFPSGTRYRPGKPETKRGLREIDSYLRLFDVMIPVSINGNCLRISEDNPKDMMCDLVTKDKVIISAGKVYECKKFRNDILATLDNYDGDKKQVIVDHVMDILNEQHEKYEVIRNAE